MDKILEMRRAGRSWVEISWETGKSVNKLKKEVERYLYDEKYGTEFVGLCELGRGEDPQLFDNERRTDSND
ncbi:hypothetical protein DRQ25_18545 [Candidatus Fermentibacteria bacterium]|nr:MAG: hypothetical protein DRQ25_18545 [Candidatus Fermentibacteria bacterium]